MSQAVLNSSFCLDLWLLIESRRVKGSEKRRLSEGGFE